MKRLVLSAAVVIAAAGCLGRPADSASGEDIYLQLCSNCHGAELEGGLGPALGFGSNVMGQPDEFLRVSILEGRGRMPSFESSLSDEQVDLLIGYIREGQGL
jgi:cytochrome c550